jgi:F420-dependent methylenetetrahydromethanopterin dehydrogenase
MTLRQYMYLGLGALIVFALGYGTGRYAVPPKVVEKVVTKEVEKKDDNIVTTVTETKAANGATTTVTQTVDKSVETIVDTSSSSTTITNKAGYNIQVGMGYQFKTIGPTYMISAQKQFIGPLSLGVWGVTDGTVGLSVGYSF